MQTQKTELCSSVRFIKYKTQGLLMVRQARVKAGQDRQKKISKGAGKFKAQRKRTRSMKQQSKKSECTGKGWNLRHTRYYDKLSKNMGNTLKYTKEGRL